MHWPCPPLEPGLQDSKLDPVSMPFIILSMSKHDICFRAALPETGPEVFPASFPVIRAIAVATTRCPVTGQTDL